MQAGGEGCAGGCLSERGALLGESGKRLRERQNKNRERERTVIRTETIMPLCVIPSLRGKTSIAGPLATWELSLEDCVRGGKAVVYRGRDSECVTNPLRPHGLALHAIHNTHKWQC